MIEKTRNTIKQWFATKKKALEKWAYKHGLNAIIWAFLFIVVVIIIALTVGWRNILEIDTSELLRLLIYGIGGIGATVGLRIAIQRQEKYSDQVDVQTAQMRAQANQSFNDRLGRGVELLTKEDTIMRSAGIRVLVDLADSTTDAQKPIVANIIYDFFRDEASIGKYKHSPTHEEISRQDVQNALNFIVSVSIDDRKKLYPNWLFASRLNFRKLDFSNLDFSDKMLKNIDFSNSYICETKFNNTNFQGVTIRNAKIEDSYFHNAKLEQVRFFRVDISRGKFRKTQITDCSFRFGTIVKSRFYRPIIERVVFSEGGIKFTNFDDADVIDVEFDEVNFEQGKFESKNEIKVSSKYSLPHFTSTDLGLTIFDFDDGIEPSDFFELCYYNAEQKSTRMDASRRYSLRKGWGNVFVESNERWSGKPLNGWVKLERAAIETEKRDIEEHRIRMAEENAENMSEQEYQQSPPHPIEEADQLLKREMESLKRFEERERKKNANPKPKARTYKPKAKKHKPKTHRNRAP